MEIGLLGQIFASFGAGLAISLSPCVYPLLPITLGYFGTQAKEGRKLTILFYFLGQAITFTLLGIFAVYAGQALGITSETPEIRMGIGIILILFGLISFWGKLPSFFSKMNNKNVNIQIKLGGPLLSALIFGIGSALLISPCTSPLLSGVLSLVSTTETFKEGTILMFSYSLGFSSLFLILGLGLTNIKKLPKTGKWMQAIHIISSLTLLGVGAYYLLNAWTD